MQLLLDTSRTTPLYCTSAIGTQCLRSCTLNINNFSRAPLAHVAFSSRTLIDSAFKIISTFVDSRPRQECRSGCLSPAGSNVTACVVVSILASSLVDIIAFQQLCNESPFAKALSAKLSELWTHYIERISTFFIHAKKNAAILTSLCNSFSLRILLEMTFLLQSTCSHTGGLDVYIAKFHQIGNLISRLFGSIISQAEDQIDVKEILDRLCASAYDRVCIVREVLLRVLLSLTALFLNEINKGSSTTQSLLSKLRWIVTVVENVLLYRGSSLSFDPLTADPPNFACPQHPIILLLEKAIIALFVNSASRAMRNVKDSIWGILSGSLMRLLHAWCKALLENLTISTTGLWLLILLAQEPHIIADKAVTCCPNVLTELKNNLQMLDAIFSFNSGKSIELLDSEGICVNTDLCDYVGDHDDVIRKNVDYNKVSSAVQILFERVENVCLNFGRISWTPSSYKSISFPFSPGPPCFIEHFDWLSGIREANEAGQRHWSILFSQYRHILDVMAPFYWMVLGGTLSHECSVFSTMTPRPAFSHVDAFEDRSRQRCRRRPVVIWIDNHFVRTSSTRFLGRYLESHPLNPLMMRQSTYTPSRGLARERCTSTQCAQFPPSCQALFPPSAVALSDQCLGVWSCRLIEISDSLPFEGDLTLDTNWIHLVINNKELSQNHTDFRNPDRMATHGSDEDPGQKEVLACPLQVIVRVLERRFELRDLALEFFFERTCGIPPVMIAFRSTRERDDFIRCLVDACGLLRPRPFVKWWQTASGQRKTALSHFVTARSGRWPPLSLRSLCDTLVAPFPTPFIGRITRAHLLDAQVAWLCGQMSNFDYIMALNTAAGRTYNDITQYPIFPWVIGDYQSEVLDLQNTSSSFRRLDRPISVQTDSRMRTVSRRYDELKVQQLEMDMAGWEEQRALLCPAFHYPSFCSNEAIILHFLFRLIPYAFRLIQFQDGNFDDPDRLFHSVASEWSLATSSTACVKELIPEFYFRPDIFVNCENFVFGTRYDGEIVDSVKLPLWAKGDPRIFVLVNRAALESPYVTAHLPEWIDLVFGYKQSGRLGEGAVNLYHPFTYFGAINVDNIQDPLRRAAVQSMIRNYGQVPRQLFPLHPHPRRTSFSVIANMSADRRWVSSSLSRLIHYVLSRQHAMPTLRDTMVHDELQLSQSAFRPPSFANEEEHYPSYGMSTVTSAVPLTAGAPLDTVKGLCWGDWAGSPLSKTLGISWYANLRGGSRAYRLRNISVDQSHTSCAVLVTDSNSSLFLLRIPYHPLLIVKVSLLLGMIGIVARRFADGFELYSTVISLPFVEAVLTFVAAPSVNTKTLSTGDQIYLFVGTSCGGLYERTLSIKELLSRFISNNNDERQFHQPCPMSGKFFYFDDSSYNNAKSFGTLTNQQRCLSFPIVTVGWRCLIGHTEVPIICVDACPQHGLIASGDRRGHVIVWDLASTAFIALLEMDASSGVFGGVCGVSFNQTLGDLLVARVGPTGPHEIWIGLFTADCRQCCSRILDFRAELGFTTDLNSFMCRNSQEVLPIVYSHSRSYKVGCILIGGPNGCLIWLNSWTLDTVSIMRLDQPSRCPIVALSFSPSANPGRSNETIIYPENSEQAHSDSALYVVDFEGWIYFLEPDPKLPSRRLRIHVSDRKSQSSGTHQLPDITTIHMPGIWL